MQNKFQLQGITPEVNHVVPSQQNVYFVGDSHCIPPAWQAIRIKVNMRIFSVEIQFTVRNTQSILYALTNVIVGFQYCSKPCGTCEILCCKSSFLYGFLIWKKIIEFDREKTGLYTPSYPLEPKFGTWERRARFTPSTTLILQSRRSQMMLWPSSVLERLTAEKLFYCV